MIDPNDLRKSAYRIFLNHLARRKISVFHKSMIRTDPVCQMMFKAMPIFERCLTEMTCLNLLAKEGRAYRVVSCEK